MSFRIEGLELMMAQAGNLADGRDIVCVIDKSIANSFIERYHYSLKGRESSHINYGCYHDGMLCAVVAYALPTAKDLVSSLPRCLDIEWLELTRLVRSGSMDYPLSKVVAITLRDLARRGNYVVVSYADYALGHEGYIYQACNFIYTGRSADRRRWVVVGNDVHARHVKRPDSDVKERHVGTGFVEYIGKHRYFYFAVKSKALRRRLTKELKYPQLPYPKGQERNYTINGGKVEWTEINMGRCAPY